MCIKTNIKSITKPVNKNVIPCGIDTRIFKKMDKLKCRESLEFGQKKYILFAGDPNIGVKNYKLALQSFEMYLKKFKC